MAKPKSKSHKIQGHFIQLPTRPFKSAAYKRLTNNAKLIFDLMAKGYDGYNNGSLVATFDGFKQLYGISLAKRTFYQCINELIKADLVFRIYKGHKGKVSRYALCLWPIDETDDVMESKDFRPTNSAIEKYLRHEKN